MQQEPKRRAHGLVGPWLMAPSLAAIGLLFAWLWVNGEGAPLRIQQVATSAPAQPEAAAKLQAALSDPTYVLTRRDLVTFVRILGVSPLADRQHLEQAISGRRFQVEVPLGCGPAISSRSTASAHWWYDDADQAIRLQALPETWASANRRRLTSVSVFWITRPRRNDAKCPAGLAPKPASQPLQDEPRIGLAAATATLTPASLPNGWRWYTSAAPATAHELADIAPQLRLRLEGAIERAPAGGATICNSGVDRTAPDCALVSRIDRVAFVNRQDGSLLAQWGSAAAQ